MAILFPLHLVFMITGFVVFTFCFVTGLAFLLRESQLKNRRMTSLAGRFPALETMDRIHYKVLASGFVLLSLGMIVGGVLSKLRDDRFFSVDAREVGALVTWGLYAVFLNVRERAGWRGRKAIFLSILGFAAGLLTFLGLRHRL